MMLKLLPFLLYVKMLSESLEWVRYPPKESIEKGHHNYDLLKLARTKYV